MFAPLFRQPLSQSQIHYYQQSPQQQPRPVSPYHSAPFSNYYAEPEMLAAAAGRDAGYRKDAMF
jgi:hypothetical protein